MGTTEHGGHGPDVTRLGNAPSPGWLTEQNAASIRATEGPAFDEAEYAARLRELRGRMARLPLDAMLVFRPSSVEYLCGFHTAETAPQPLLVTGSETHLYLPDLEVGRALASSVAGSLHYCGYADALRGLELFIRHAATVLPQGARVGVEVGHGTPRRRRARWSCCASRGWWSCTRTIWSSAPAWCSPPPSCAGWRRQPP